VRTLWAHAVRPYKSLNEKAFAFSDLHFFALLCAGGSTPSARAGYDAGDFAAKKGVGKIVYASKRSGNWEIYVMHADGSGKARLTKSKENDTMPCLSPDGRRVLWVAGGKGDDAVDVIEFGGRIWIMNLDGTRKKCLTPEDKREDTPKFSFDGKKIVFDSGEEGSHNIWTMNTDGSNRKQLTSNESDNAYPAFSPDGRRIVFESNRSGFYEIYVMDATGKNLKRLTKSENWAGMPQFSPDGKSIAFSLSGDGSDAAVFLMNADGRNQRKVSRDDLSNLYLSFSPDGKRLVFGSERDENYDIYTMDLNGKDLKRLTKDKAYETQPDWK